MFFFIQYSIAPRFYVYPFSSFLPMERFLICIIKDIQCDSGKQFLQLNNSISNLLIWLNLSRVNITDRLTDINIVSKSMTRKTCVVDIIRALNIWCAIRPNIYSLTSSLTDCSIGPTFSKPFSCIVMDICCILWLGWPSLPVEEHLVIFNVYFMILRDGVDFNDGHRISSFHAKKKAFNTSLRVSWGR